MRETLRGWTLVADAGVTGRTNAVAPLAFDGDCPDAAIDGAVAWQATHGIRPCFKIADGYCFPAALPDALARRGWRQHTETLVMTAPLADAIARLPAPSAHVTLSADCAPAIDTIIRETAVSEAEYAERSAIAERTPQPRRFAMLQCDGATAAVGLTVVTGDWAAIFLMRTHPAHRRQGLARDILAALAEWAKTAGATHAYLQVEAANAPAIALYKAIAFETAYSYSYWRPEPKP